MVDAAAPPPGRPPASGDVVRLGTIAWKRRSGFGKLSGTVGVGSSWERRRVVLSGNRLSYYAVEEGEEEDEKGRQPLRLRKRRQQPPRGTLDLVSERLTACPAPFSGDMPSPYGLTIRASGSLPGEDPTRWKLCFDTRRQQAAFLLAVTDAVVGGAVRDLNAAVLEAEKTRWEHGGFHRLYEEGERGVFGTVREVLLHADGKAAGLAERAEEEEKEEKEEGDREEAKARGVRVRGGGSDAAASSSAHSVDDDDVPRGAAEEEEATAAAAPAPTPAPAPPSGGGGGNDLGVETGREGPTAAATAGSAGSSLGPGGQREQEHEQERGKTLPTAEGSLVAPSNLRPAFGIVNVAVVYSFWVSGTATVALSWWQVLLAANLGLWVVLVATSSRQPLPQRQARARAQSSVGGRDEAPSTETSDVPSKARERKTEEEERQWQQQQQQQQQRSAPRSQSERAPVALTASDVGAELLREMDVPLSEVPTEKRAGDEGSAGDEQEEEEEEEEAAYGSFSEASAAEPPSAADMEAHSHERWAVSAPDVDLSGSWTLIVDDAFKAQYDKYLRTLGFNRLTRGVAVSLISRTTEVTKQSDGGRRLYLKGINPKGAWERTIIASGYPDFGTQRHRTEGRDYVHRSVSITTADSEPVEAEAWWEHKGTVHRSWLRGGTKYGGGDFESRRYLERSGVGKSDIGGGDILVCESVMHPRDGAKEKARVTWRFRRVGNE